MLHGVFIIYILLASFSSTFPKFRTSQDVEEMLAADNTGASFASLLDLHLKDYEHDGAVNATANNARDG